jgi:DnaK suppressor protein
METKTHTNDQTRYSSEELAEFEQLIVQKIAKAKEDLNHLKSSIARDVYGESNRGNLASFDDGADALEKEELNQLAARTQRFIADLERALFRIKNGTYGVCIDTGKLIPKERLKAVPHTQQCIEAKLGKA